MKFITIGVALACVLALSGFTKSNVTFENVAVFDDTKPARIHAQLAKPDGEGKFPAVILWHTCGGVLDHVSKLWPEYFTGLGYVTLTIDSIGSRNLKNCFSPIPLLGGPSGINKHITAGDPYGALRYLATLPYVDADRVALMGFSFGGIMNAYLSNTDFATPEGRRFKTLVSFYGHCSKATAEAALYPGGDPKYPWLILVGEKEAPGFHKSCGRLASKPGVTFKVLPSAHHGWDQAHVTRPHDDGAGNIMLYSKAATEQSKTIVKEFLAAQFAR